MPICSSEYPQSICAPVVHQGNQFNDAILNRLSLLLFVPLPLPYSSYLGSLPKLNFMHSSPYVKSFMEECRPRLYFLFLCLLKNSNTYNSAWNIVGTQQNVGWRNCVQRMDKTSGIPYRLWAWESIFLWGLCFISRLIINNRCCQQIPDVLYETCCMALLKKRELPLYFHVRISRKIMFYQVNYSSLTLESSVMLCSLLINNAKTIAQKR